MNTKIDIAFVVLQESSGQDWYVFTRNAGQMGTQSCRRPHRHQVCVSLFSIHILHTSSTSPRPTGDSRAPVATMLVCMSCLSVTLQMVAYCLGFRWKRDENGDVINHPDSGKPILQFVCIQRKDSGEWALPGVSHVTVNGRCQG